MNKKVFIIAEAGVNHNGSLKTAKKMVDVASQCGADAIKFQTFNTKCLVSRYAPKARYQKESDVMSESQFEMLSKFELSQECHRELIRHCKNKGITFISSPFDLESIDLLMRFNLKIFKIPSGEITNLPYLRKIGSLGRKIILSSGMSTLEEVRKALNILISSGTRKQDITVLHCNTEYPTPMEDANLNAMLSIRDKFKVRVGYSDHTPGIEVSIAAVALGASVIEKHFTLNKGMVGPDHKASLEPSELRNLVNTVRNIEKAMGDGKKKLSPSESRNIEVVRKSIVAARDIQKGEIFNSNNITTKRPGTGISPMKWDNVIGGHAKKDFMKDELIRI